MTEEINETANSPTVGLISTNESPRWLLGSNYPRSLDYLMNIYAFVSWCYAGL